VEGPDVEDDRDMTTGQGPRPATGGGVTALLLVGGVALALLALLLGVAFLVDRQAAPNLLANIHDVLGNSAEAAALRAGGGDQTAAKLLLAVVALIVGVGGVWLFYTGLNVVAERFLPKGTGRRVLPWVFVGPALVLLLLYLVLPAASTIILSLTVGDGLANYEWALTHPSMQAVLRNNLIWLVVGTTGSVGLGLLIAGLVDRVKHESFAKMIVFMPLAISLVGASVIWRFVYAWRPEGQAQYGLLNAVWTAVGFDAVQWIQTPGLATFALIVILIWLQTGFCMVVLSAAIKGVPTEITEAARLDGATERQLFLRIVVPTIMGSIITVTITTAIVVLKVFDIVFVMTGGRFDTDVVANQMFLQKFQFFNDGRAATLATILFIAVLPLMFFNLRNIRRQGIR
jgi:alpha-glucoside transport system permease protein